MCRKRRHIAQSFHLPPVKITIIAPSSALMRILIGLFTWRANVDVDVDVARTVFLEIIAIIADVTIIKIRNKNAIHRA